MSDEHGRAFVAGATEPEGQVAKRATGDTRARPDHLDRLQRALEPVLNNIYGYNKPGTATDTGLITPLRNPQLPDLEPAYNAKNRLTAAQVVAAEPTTMRLAP